MTLALGVIIGLAIGILFITKALEGIETDSFMYVRKPFALAWIVAASSNVVFSICINTIAFRKINKVPLIDIRKY